MAWTDLPPIGSRGRLVEPHPRAGQSCKVMTYEVFQGDLAVVVALDDPPGAQAGVLDQEDFAPEPDGETAGLVKLVADGLPDTAAAPAAALEVLVSEPWRAARTVQLHTLDTGEVRQGSPGAIALVLLEETELVPPPEDYCRECPHCNPAVSVALDYGADGDLRVVAAEPCEWCGHDFGTVLFGPDRHECRDEDHLAHGVGCDNCGACLHASHGR